MIRSLTIGIPIYSESPANLSERLTSFRISYEKLAQEHLINTRTIRLTLPPPGLDHNLSPDGLRSMLDVVQKLANDVGARWYCLPVDLFSENARDSFLSELQSFISRDSQLFVNLIAATENEISMSGVQSASKFILNLARRSSNGIDNFRVGISAACPAGTPFFPFARHHGDSVSFSIAMETTSLALKIAEHARREDWPLSIFQAKLINILCTTMLQVDRFGNQLAEECQIDYAGLDASFAPFPDGFTSVAKVIELMGPTPIGSYGTVFMTSVLTDAIKEAARLAGIKTIGFNGVMFSVLEDNGLTDANNFRALTIDKLALYSTVCGCGIDMVPVSSTVFHEDLSSLILDVASLAVRLKKPLGVRLLPIPNKLANEYTQLNLDFLCDSRVMDTGISASKILLSDDVWRYNKDREII